MIFYLKDLIGEAMSEEVVYCKHCTKIARWMYHRELDILTADSDNDPQYEVIGEPVCDDCRNMLEKMLDEGEI